MQRYTDTDIVFMKRALQLARNGEYHASPNPMVGAVIVAEGRIIGEGWHRKCGEPHAEVNAINDVLPQDQNLLPSSTIYVTLEPCSHYGKTPPCAKLLIEKRVKRVVIGSGDPFKEVAGRGIKMLRDAGIEVVTGVLENECRELNRKFMLAHTLHRPYILLKWAESSDGMIAGGEEHRPISVSTSTSLPFMHKERALQDAIMAGTDTLLNDNPSLTCRAWCGDSPTPVIFDSKRFRDHNLRILDNSPVIIPEATSLKDAMRMLYENQKVTSLIVEGGAKLLSSFIEENLYDEIRVEISPMIIGTGLKAPELPLRPNDFIEERIGGNYILHHYREITH